MWYSVEAGAGSPLVLLHGLGMSHRAWATVMPFLSSTRRVIAFDIAGFGRTPPVSPGHRPIMARLLEGLARSLEVVAPGAAVDIAGNSLGGRLALEAAAAGLARSVVAISPPGLWQLQEPAHVKYVFGGMRLLTRTFPRAMRQLVNIRLCRELLLAVPLSPGSGRMDPKAAAGTVEDLASAVAFDDTFLETRAPFHGAGIRVPVTVAFGTRDWILRASARRRDTLPAHTRWLDVRGWGHVPTWMDPVGVARVILEGTEQR
jgi:pimeloyl-ACP methyl ester carboxylesterase